jgi:uncharacterized protein (DUF2249 family)
MIETRDTGKGRSIDVRAMPARERHPRIFAEFDALADGRELLLTTDHEPRPLRGEFEQKRAGAFLWQQRCVGHRHWEAVIRKLPHIESANDAAELLRRSGTFAGTSEASIELLGHHARVARVRRNRAVVEQGIFWPHLGIVAAGTVQAVLVTPDGRELAMYEVFAGDTFGALALSDGGSSPLRYVARTERTRIVLLAADAVREVMRRDANVSNAIGALCAQRVRTILERFSAHAAQPIAARVAYALLAYASPEPGLTDALPPLSQMRQVEFAVAAGTGKDIVYRAIAELEDAGALAREDGKIVRLDRDKLTAFADVLKY